MRSPYLYGQLFCAAICFFSALINLIAGLRLRRERARELYFAGAQFFLGVGAIVYFQILSGSANPWWTRSMGANTYLVFLFLLLAIDTYHVERSRASQGLVALALASALLNFVPGWPAAFVATGDLVLPWLGRVPSVRMPLAAALWNIGFGLICTCVTVFRARQGQQRGHDELKAMLPFAAAAFPLFGLDLAAFLGWVAIPPPGAYVGGVATLFLAWFRLEQQASLVAAEERQNQLGGYKLIRRLGAGGMAEVFLAERQGPAGFTKQVAIKRLLPHMTEDARSIAMFLDEARLAARLSHPNIVQINELGQSEGSGGAGPTYFIVMEYLPGVALTWLERQLASRKEHLPPVLVAQIGVQLLAALHCAHTLLDEKGAPLGIVHRDVSPHNAILTETGVVKLLDFGIARAAGRSVRTRTGMTKGKVPYMAPEQARGGTLDARTDLFAVGVTLFELCCGGRPFDGASDVETLQRILDGNHWPPKRFGVTLPTALEAVILRAIAPDPARRYQSAELMAVGLKAFLTEEKTAPDTTGLAAFLAREIARPTAPLTVREFTDPDDDTVENEAAPPRS